MLAVRLFVSNHMKVRECTLCWQSHPLWLCVQSYEGVRVYLMLAVRTFMLNHMKV